MSRVVRWASVVVALSAGGVAQATSGTWSKTSGGPYNWLDPTNWTSGNVPNGPGETASITANLTAIQTINLNAAITNSTLTIGDSGSSYLAYTLAAGTGGSLTLDNSGGAVSITKPTSQAADVISAPITLAGNATFNNSQSNAGRTLTLSGGVGEVGGARNVTVTGGGSSALVILSGASTYSGDTTITSGNLRLNHADALPSTGLLTISGGALELQAPTSFTRPLGSGSGDVRIPGGVSGFSSRTASVSINIDNDGSTLLWGGSDFAPSELVLNNGAASAALAFENGLDLNGATRTITVNANTANANGDIVNTAGGTYGVTKKGSGQLNLNGTSTYTGPTTVLGGILGFNTIADADGTASALGAPVGDTDGTIKVGTTTTGATVQFNGTANATSDRVFDMAGTTGGLGLQSSGTGALVLTSDLTASGSGNKTLTLGGAGTAANELQGAIVDSAGFVTTLTKADAGLWILSGTSLFKGKTSITGGTLSINSIANADNASALGAPAAANGAISVGSGTTTGVVLRYTGTGHTTDRPINLAGSTGGANLDASGSGPLVFTADFTAVTGNKTLAIRGTSTETNTIAGKIVDFNAGSTNAVAKSEAGTWVLTGASTYKGKTSISAGTLVINSLANADGTASALGAPGKIADGTIAIGSSTTPGTLVYTGSGHTSDRVVNLAGTTGGATLDASGTGPLVLTSAFTATGAGVKTLTLTGASTAANTVQGAIINGSGTTGISKIGDGTWVLAGINSFTGATTVSGGVLRVTGSLAAGSAVGVNAGGTLAGTGTSHGTVTSNVGGTLSPGLEGTAGGTLTVSNLVLNAGSTNVFEFSATPANDKIIVAKSGGFVVNGGGILLVAEGASSAWTTDGLYDLIQYSGALTGSPANLVVLNPQAGKSYLFSASGGWLRVTISSAAQAWDGGSSANANWLTAENWNPDGAPAAYAALTFAGTTRLSTVNNNAANTPFGGFSFDSTAGAFTLDGAAVDLVGNVVNDSAATQTIDLPLVLEGGDRLFDAAAGDLVVDGAIGDGGDALGVIKAGDEDLTLGGENTYAGATTVNAGTLTVRNGAGLGATAAGTTVADGAALQFAGGVAVGAEALTIEGTGVAAGGALRNVADTNSVGGAIALGTTGATIASDAGTLALAGAISGIGKPLTLDGAGDVALSGGVGTSTGGTLTKNGAGRATLSAASTFTGALTVNAGTLAANTSTAALGAGALVLNGGTLAFNNGTALNFARNTTVGGDVAIGSDRDAPGDGLTYTLGTLTITTQTVTAFGGDNVTGGTAGITFGTTTLGGSPLLNLQKPTGGGTTLLTLGAITGGANALALTGNGDFAQAGVWSGNTGAGSGPVLTAGYSGVASLNQANTFTGPVVVRGGTLRALSSTSALGASTAADALTLDGGTVWMQDSTARNFGRNTTVSANATITLDRPSTSIGAGGSWTLGALSIGNQQLTVRGGDYVTSGTALLTFGATTLTGSPTLAINKPANGGTTQVTLGAVTDDGNTITVTGNGLLAQSAARTGTGGLVLDSAFTGTNTLNQANTFTGGIEIKGGTLVGNTHAGSFSTTGAIVLGDSAGSADAALDFAGTGHTSTHTAGITVAAGSSGTKRITTTGGNSFVYGAPITLDDDVTVSPTTSLRLGGAVGGAGALTKVGAGTLTLEGDNDYAGSTTITTGSLQVGNGGATGTVGQGPVVNNAALTVNRTGTNTMDNVISGSGTLTKTGAGTLVLGGDNSYDGLTTVSVGTLRARHDHALGSALGATTVSSGATLSLDGGIEVLDEALSLSGTLNSLSGANRYAGAITLLGTSTFSSDAGQLQIATASRDGSSNRNATLSGAGDGIFEGPLVLGGTGDLTKNGAGTWTLVGDNIVDNITVNDGVLQIGNGGASGTVGDNTISVNAPGLLRFARSDYTMGMTVTGSGSLENAGPGRLTLTGANAYTGPTFIAAASAGLDIGNGGTAGAVGTGTVTNNAVLHANRSDSSTISAPIIGTGSFVKSGGGTTTLTGDNSYAGTTTINAGTLQIGNGGATGSLGAGDVTDNGTLTFNRSDDLVVSQLISGSGGVTKTGAGRVTFPNAKSYDGNTTVSAGALRIEDAGALGSAAGYTTASAGSLELANVGTLDEPLRFSGSGAGGAGALLNVAGDNTISGTVGAYGNGTIGVDAGTLVLANAASIARDGTNYRSLTLAGNGDGEVQGTVVLGGASTTTFSNLSKTGGGTWTLGGTGTFNGLTSILDGTLRLTHPEALRTSTLVHTNAYAGTLDLTSLTALTLGGLIGDKEFVLENAMGDAIALNVGTNNIQSRYLGRLTGKGSLAKVGSNDFIIEAGDCDYEGPTTIVNGRLLVGYNSTTGSLGTNDIFALGGKLEYRRQDACVVSNNLVGACALVNSGTNVLTMAGHVDISGTTTILANSAYGPSGHPVIQFGDGTSHGGLSNRVAAIDMTTASNDCGHVVFDFPDDTYVTGAITGSGTVRHIGTGRVLLVASGNSWSGETWVDQGTLVIGNWTGSGWLGTNVVHNNGIVEYSRASYNNPNVVTMFTGTGRLVQNGTNAPIALASASDYTGGTIVSNGTLLAINTDGLATGPGLVEVVGAASTLGGSGAVGNVAVGTGGSLLGGTNGVGTLTTGNVVMDASAHLAVQLAQPGTSGLVNVVGDATVAGTVNVTDVAPGLFTNGSYTLLTCTGTFTDDGLTLGTVPSGFVATLVVDTLNREVRLVTKTPGTVVLVY